VMFHPEISYADAQRRGAAQTQILAELTAGASKIAEIDLRRAATLITERL
jgi:hypothetical protein